MSTFIAIGALVSLIFAWQAVNASHNAIQEAHEQTVQAHRQADAAEQSYVATIRAWMDVNVSQSPISFEWNKNMGPGITATVIGTNEGNSPALLASVSLLLVPEEFGLGPGELLRRDCVDIDFPPFGNLVLPKKEIERTGTTFVPWDRIKEAVYRSTAEEAAVSLGNPGDSDKIVFFYVFACATYRIIGDDRWHHTGKVYQLERFSISDQRVKSGFILGNEMPGTRFVVKREPDGDYAD